MVVCRMHGQPFPPGEGREDNGAQGVERDGQEQAPRPRLGASPARDEACSVRVRIRHPGRATYHRTTQGHQERTFLRIRTVEKA